MLSTSQGIGISSPHNAPIRLLTRAEASALARLSMNSIDRAVVAGELEPVEYVGHHPRFRESDLLAWMERRRESKHRDPFAGALRVLENIAQREMAE